MRRVSLSVVALLALLTGLLGAVPAASADPKTNRGGGLEVYIGEITAAQLRLLAEQGVELEGSTHPGVSGRTRIEAILTADQAARLTSAGVPLSIRRVKGKKASEAAKDLAAQGYQGFRSYSQPNGIQDELQRTAAARPDLAKLVKVGRTTKGQDILAVKVTKNARYLPDGLRPAVLYVGAQHAREWITPEMVRRLMHEVIDGYGRDPETTALLNKTELWFMPVANPDGYDYTFTTERQWRKTLRDNNGDGQTGVGDGVDPNRNFPYKWGWDNEGSSTDPASETFRGTGPASEPETKALDSLMAKVRFEFLIDYHSAAELILYGVGWQTNTPSPDDVVYEAMAGDDTEPAVPGYDPDLSAELYTTNGETDGHAQATYGTLSFTPEMSTCQTVSAIDPDDQWKPEDCLSVFTFPDDEKLIAQEYEKNVPFALAVAKSAHDPANPVSVVGRTAKDMTIDPFTVSRGTTQPVAVTAKRELLNLRMHYSVNGGRAVSKRVQEWQGGERYGTEGSVWLAEYRGTVTRTRPGDSVTVWFTGIKPRVGPVRSDSFTYTVSDDIGGDVLVLAAEDVTGVSPTQGVSSAKYAGTFADALTAAGYSSDLYDVDVQGRTAPHPLGVLSHYQAIVWESGDDIIPRAPGQVGGTADDLTLQLELAVRDYLNEGGKALVTGKYNRFAESNDGAYWFDPFAPPECTTPGAYPCLPLLNDFEQYWLGADNYISDGGTDGDGNPFPVSGASGAFTGFLGSFGGPDSAQNQDHTASMLTTSSSLPKAQFPQFASSAPLKWDRPGGSPYEPVTGAWYVWSNRADNSWKRLTRTVDLTGAGSGSLSFKASLDTEADWDFAFVEAHEVGTDNWTTLPDTGGLTDQDTGQSCASGWADIHPFVGHYQGAGCSATGSTGTWNAASGNSGGWKTWNVDLTPYAGKQVEVSISYVSDWATQGLGVFIDDTAVTVGGAATSTSFESDLGGWTVAPPPAGSAPGTATWTRSQHAFEEGSAITTDDTVYTGFGVEGLSDAAVRADFVKRAMAHLLH
ncbi:MAG: immune inhibitor A [Intrasporangium sp.]|uniref:M14 family metallopeptidase n=1 Tax=Intrasporangium sp. TaxID=1925024 RepID=UPI0026488577|nr:M14 family metallopeptidase [Intrasporangium sp.]MDN5796858.1 immune inhibitor A [Intrasporangium sp.]